MLAEVNNTFEYMKNFDVSKALMSIFNIFTLANTYIQKVEPWALAKDENKKDRLAVVMKNLIESIRLGSQLLQPFLPESSTKVLNALGIDSKGEFENMDNFDGVKAGTTLESPGILFPRLDKEAEFEKLANLVNKK